MNVIICNFAIFGPIFINFHQKHNASFCEVLAHFFMNWEGVDILLQIWPEKIPV